MNTPSRGDSYISLYTTPPMVRIIDDPLSKKNREQPSSPPLSTLYRSSMARILVAYATKHGSTTGIAEAIGKELTTAGQNVEVKELKNVQSPAGYDAVIIGGPIYMGKVMADVKKFVDRHQEKLAALPVATFVVGLSPASKDEKQIGDAKKALADAVAPLQPVASTLFAGNLDPKKLGFMERTMIGMVKSPTGDFRDWEAIAAWAKGLPSLLVKG